MSTWYKVSTSGQLHGRLELPDEFEQYIRRLEAERDEARKSAQEWGDLWRKMNDLRIRATKERDEARRWAVHYKRLYEALVNKPPFVATHDGDSITRQSKGRKAKGAK